MNKQTRFGFHGGVPQAVREHLTGQSAKHKFLFGFFISLFGVVLAHLCIETHVVALVLFGEHVGYGLHGIGYIPMYKALEEGGKA